MIYNMTFSPTGGTKKVADILVSNFGAEYESIDLCNPAFTKIDFTSEAVAVISVPSYAGRVPCTATERIAMMHGNDARVILVCVYGNRAYDNTLAEMKDIAEKTGFRPIAAVAAIAEHSVVRILAAGRPDRNDAVVLAEMALYIKKKLNAGDDTPIHVPGTAPEKPIGNIGGKMAPMVTETCTHCGICADECPTQAICLETMEADQVKCIGCMRCISVCPSEARRLAVTPEKLGGVPIDVLCSNRQKNALFI